MEKEYFIGLLTYSSTRTHTQLVVAGSLSATFIPSVLNDGGYFLWVSRH